MTTTPDPPPRCSRCGVDLLVFFDEPQPGSICTRCSTPPACKVCGDAMTRERGGQFDRCVKCWRDLLAVQPVRAAS